MRKQPGTFLNRLALIFALLLLTATAQAAHPTAAQQVRQGPHIGIAAIVNDDAITFSDLDNRLNLYLSGNPQVPPPEVRKKLVLQVLDKLIDEKLELQQAKTLGITVGDDQINEAFATIAKQNNSAPDVFKKKLAASGIHFTSLQDQIRAEIAWSQVVRRKLRPEVNISESEIDSTIDLISRGRGRTEYQVAEILLTVPSANMDDTVRHDAEKLVEQITKGASFSQVAKQFSQAPGATQGGDLGWVGKGQLDTPLDEALSKMHPGEVSPPIRTAKGYHILFLRDIHAAGSSTDAAAGVSPHPLSDPAPGAAAPTSVTPAPAAAPAVAATDAIVHLKQITIPISASDPPAIIAAKMNRAEALKQEIASCEEMDQKSKDFLTPGTGDLGSGPLSHLPAPLRAAVENLPVGTLSAPVRSPDGVAVAMVCGRTNMQGAPVAASSVAARPAAPAAGKTATASAAPGYATPQPETGVPHKAPLGPIAKSDESSRNEVANQIGIKRLDQMAARYLLDLRAAAYIEIRL